MIEDSDDLYNPNDAIEVVITNTNVNSEDLHMIKKEFNKLYKEIEQIRRKIDSGKLKYFGEKNYMNASTYYVFLKNGYWFKIELGTKIIPTFNKNDVVFIQKHILRDSTDTNWKYTRDYVDSDRGFVRYSGCIKDNIDYFLDRANKYKINLVDEIETYYWD